MKFSDEVGHGRKQLVIEFEPEDGDDLKRVAERGFYFLSALIKINVEKKT